MACGSGQRFLEWQSTPVKRTWYQSLNRFDRVLFRLLACF